MVTKKKSSAKKLKLKKETIRDLNAGGGRVKGGGVFRATMPKACAGRPGAQDGTTMPSGTVCGLPTAGCGVIPGH